MTASALNDLEKPFPMTTDAPFILLVDDEPAILALLSEQLAGEGYNTLQCRSGREAIGVLQRERPCLVIVDLQMERRDSGIAVVQMLRLNPGTEQTPALVMSADGRFLRDKVRQLRDHACEILEKPFDIDELLTLVHHLLGQPPR
jgi:CheY-like chemotaxis protein